MDLEAAESLRCPECAEGVEEQWLACPACRTRLAHRCVSCQRSVGLDWVVCAWCAAEFGRPMIADAVPAPVALPVLTDPVAVPVLSNQVLRPAEPLREAVHA